MYKNLLEVLDRRGVRTGKPFFLALDVSGGMQEHNLEAFLQALETALSVLLPSEVTILQFDHRVTDIKRMSPSGFRADKFRLEGGGGTNPEKAFGVARELGATDLFVYTDGLFDLKFDRYGVNSTYLLPTDTPQGITLDLNDFGGSAVVLT